MKQVPHHSESSERNALKRPRRALRVLLVEDSDDDAELLLLELRRGGYDPQPLRVQTAEEMRGALGDATWDVVISDHSLPRFSSPAAFDLLRGSGLDIPFIIVSGTVGEDVAVEAMRTGVNDFMIKGNLRRLPAAIERELREAASRAERRRIQEQLMISERMASVGILAAGVAHEINNPLSVVIGNQDFLSANLSLAGALLREVAASAGESAPEPLLRATALVSSLLGPMDDVQEAAERVRVIVRDLRSFSRADDEPLGPVDVHAVLASSIRMARNEIRHRARLVQELGVIPPVRANEARLGQVFLNLLVNAAQSMPDGKTDRNNITVRTHLAGGRVVVDISDTGAGISADVLPHIFDVFFTTKPVGVGTGLGLAICHRIVTTMGGEISVESRVGLGTRFRVELPVAAGEATPEPPAQPASPALARRRLASVLIIEDERPVARLLARLLAGAYQITQAPSGRQALALLDGGQRFDVILCDLMMPEMTGMEVHQHLTARDPEQARRMIFISGGAFTPGALEFLDHVENARLDKPIDVAALRQAVELILADRPPPPSA